MRLRRRAEYLALQALGRKVHGTYVLLLYRPAETTRIGITVSGRVGNAVVRNRIKRWIKEHVRRHRAGLPSGELVIVAKTSAKTADHQAVSDDLARALRRL